MHTNCTFTTAAGLLFGGCTIYVPHSQNALELCVGVRVSSVLECPGIGFEYTQLAWGDLVTQILENLFKEGTLLKSQGYPSVP